MTHEGARLLDALKEKDELMEQLVMHAEAREKSFQKEILELQNQLARLALEKVTLEKDVIQAHIRADATEGQQQCVSFLVGAGMGLSANYIVSWLGF